MSKSATTTALDISELLLLVFGAVLTIGALGEYKKFPRLLRASLATFELMVVIGIAGELLADGAIFVFSRHLQTISEGEFATLNNEAGIARDDAAKALLEQEHLKTENLKLEALIQPRSLTLDQQRDIGKALLPFKGRNIVISWDPTGAEPYNFAQQLKASLRAGKLAVEERTPATNGTWYPVYETGVLVSWPPGQKDLGEALGKALCNIGHVRKLRVAPESEPSHAVTEPVYISVWLKPFDVLPNAQACSTNSKASTKH